MERIDSLDTLKGLALLAVVIIHVRGSFLTTLGTEKGFFDLTLFSISRFGVPVFFLISGFLVKKKFDEKNEAAYIRKYVRKLLIYYILASALYLVLQTAIIFIEANTGFSMPRDISMATSLPQAVYGFLYTGTAIRGSLWFFPALIISASLIYISEKIGKFDYLLGLSLLLHFTGILSNTYHVLELPTPARDAVFFGLVFTALGFKIGNLNTDKLCRNYTKILTLSGMFLGLNILENLFLMNFTGASFIFQDYSLATLPFAVSVFLLALSKPDLGSSTRINLYGKYTLLAYVFHQVIGGLLTGTAILIGLFLGVDLPKYSSLNLLLVALTYIVTMEAVILYRKGFDSL